MYLATSLSSSTSWLSLTSPPSVTSGEIIQRRSGIIHVLHKLNKLCKSNTILNNLLIWATLLTCHHLTLSLTGFAVGSIEYSLCIFGQFGKLRNHFYTYAECHRPTLSPTVFAVASIGYSLCSFIQFGNTGIRVPNRLTVGSTEHSYCILRQLARFRLAIWQYTHLPSPDTVYDKVCRWFERVFSLPL